jgi:hypothetical protein
VPRKINPFAIAMLDERIASNTLAQDCLKNQQARQLFVEVVKSCIGIQEVGKNKGKEVEAFLSTLKVPAGEPWCMAFMQTCLAYVETKLKVVSPIHASAACVQTWEKTDPAQRVKLLPLAGAIAIWKHTENPATGHTGMVLDCDSVSFHAIEGNTSEGRASLNNAVTWHGDGVRWTHRRYDLFNAQSGDMLLMGCLKPF